MNNTLNVKGHIKTEDKLIVTGNITTQGDLAVAGALKLTPDASIEVQHHEGASSYGTITYSASDKEWNINPSSNNNE
jgi:hypothetical protein